MRLRRKPCFRLIVLALVNLAFLLLCRETAVPVIAGALERKWNAVALVERAHKVLGTRLLGPEYTAITTTLAPLEAKRLSLHPDFAAVVVDLLTAAGVHQGDSVAVNLTGSFPGLNVAVLAGVQAVKARPVITSSIGASTWGATDPNDTWLDMERALVDAGVWSWQSAAASLGGVGDHGGGLDGEGVALAREAIKRAGVRVIEAAGLEDAIAQRAELYQAATGSLPVALVNVGGSHVFFGAKGHEAPLRQGLNRGYRSDLRAADGLGMLFLGSNRPVIHFVNIEKMAAEYGIDSGLPVGGSAAFLKRKVPGGIKWLIVLWFIFMLTTLWFGGKRGWWRGGMFWIET